MSGFAVLFSVFLGGLWGFHQLERWRPIHAHYRTGYPRRGYVADLLWTAVNGPGLSALEKIAFAYLVLWVPADSTVLGGWSFSAQFALFFLVNDFGRYWFHRLYHDVEMLWRVHRVHHTVVQMDALSVFRHHVLEAVVKNGLLILPLRLLGVGDEVIIAYSVIDILKGYWHHANFRCHIGPLNYVLNSPELHWWHHAIDPRGQRSNFGSTLSVWDWLFGTAYWPRRWPDRIGVDGMDAFPDSFLGQLVSVVWKDQRLLARLHATDEHAGERHPGGLEVRSGIECSKASTDRAPTNSGPPFGSEIAS